MELDLPIMDMNMNMNTSHDSFLFHYGTWVINISYLST